MEEAFKNVKLGTLFVPLTIMKIGCVGHNDKLPIAFNLCLSFPHEDYRRNEIQITTQHSYLPYHKITVICNFFKKYLFIYLSISIPGPFKVTPLKYNTLISAFFLIPETLVKCAFWYRQQLSPSSPQS